MDYWVENEDVVQQIWEKNYLIPNDRLVEGVCVYVPNVLPPHLPAFSVCVLPSVTSRPMPFLPKLQAHLPDQRPEKASSKSAVKLHLLSPPPAPSPKKRYRI